MFLNFDCDDLCVVIDKVDVVTGLVLYLNNVLDSAIGMSPGLRFPYLFVILWI